ncbi:hypothetical protein [Halonatronum saccharophilum]|nr:hypothetical protein [Halonatronum saccharophilum]
MKSRNFRIDDKEGSKFKELCQSNNTDVSKALIEFILRANRSK